MLLAAEGLDFERAAQLRDQIKKLEGGTSPATGPARKRGASKVSTPAPAPANARSRAESPRASTRGRSRRR
jgi:hypothetical protein